MLKTKKKPIFAKKKNLINKKENHLKAKVIVLQPGQKIIVVAKKIDDLDEL
jgi:hypothetical protein